MSSYDDAALLRHLRGMWQAADPPPPDLADRMLFALEFDQLRLDELDIDVELLQLTAAAAPAAVRGQDTLKTVTFSGTQLTVIIVLPSGDRPPRRVDGWLSPRAALRVELRVRTRSMTTVADDDGRFAFNDVPADVGRILIHPTPGAAVELSRVLATPGIELSEP